MPITLPDSYPVRVPVQLTRPCDLLSKKQPGGITVTSVGRAQEGVNRGWGTALRQHQIWYQEVVYSGLFN